MEMQEISGNYPTSDLNLPQTCPAVETWAQAQPSEDMEVSSQSVREAYLAEYNSSSVIQKASVMAHKTLSTAPTGQH